MRRVALALVSTVTGLVLLLGFKTHAGTPSTPPAIAIATGTTATSTSTAAPRVTTVTGTAYQTRYGTVQVQITMTDGQLTDVTPVQLPQGNSRDIEIDNFAVPELRQEALAAQSAKIAMVSGASYTSDGYISSLQSALDQA